MKHYKYVINDAFKENKNIKAIKNTYLFQANGSIYIKNKCSEYIMVKENVYLHSVNLWKV